MTIDEAIKHWEDVASGHEKNCEMFKDDIELYEINREWAEKSHQLVKWLEELKRYKQNILKLQDQDYLKTQCPFGYYGEWYDGVDYAVSFIEMEGEDEND